MILLLWFSINPDGQNMVVKWYRSNLGTPYEVSNMPGLWQEYIGHDNNRDGYMNNMIESQVITAHGAGILSRRSFTTITRRRRFPRASGFRRSAIRCRSNPHPLMYRWVNVFGTAMAA